MRKKVPCLIITFHTTADAIAFEQYAKDIKLSGRLIPIPRELSAGCGMAYMIKKDTLPVDHTDLLSESNICIQQIADILF